MGPKEPVGNMVRLVASRELLSKIVPLGWRDRGAWKLRSNGRALLGRTHQVVPPNDAIL